jgi:hypothetical protein
MERVYPKSASAIDVYVVMPNVVMTGYGPVGVFTTLEAAIVEADQFEEEYGTECRILVYPLNNMDVEAWN